MINSPVDIIQYLLDLPKDKYCIGLICLGRGKDYIGQKVIASGDNTCPIYLKQFFWYAAEQKASGVILFFQHKENRRPSPSEIDIAKRIYRGCEALGIDLVDTVITDSDWHGIYSFLENDIDMKGGCNGLFDNWIAEETA